MFNFNLLVILLLLGLCFKAAKAHEQCSTYTQLENEFQCGENGYLLGYGKKYCHRFVVKNIERFTPQGQQFLIKNAKCLQEKLKEFILKIPNASCQEIENQAIETHMSCYQESGFCELRTFDKMATLAIIRDEVKYRYVRKMASKMMKFCRQNK